MNGADSLIGTLVDWGVNTCFANPGTSEMQFVAALDRQPRMRAVLCLFEGVATGAADGYGRMRGRPAATLLHLGPGYANGAANTHNARRAHTPVVNIVGDHATYHRRYDAPLNSDIAALAATSSKWVRSADSAGQVGALAREAVGACQAAPPGPATLILPADSAWNAVDEVKADPAVEAGAAPGEIEVDAVAARIEAASRPLLLISGQACSEAGLQSAARLRARGVRVCTESFVPRQRRGAGVFTPEKLAYFPEAAQAELAEVDLIVLVEAKPPVAFFAYPDKPSVLSAERAEVLTLCRPGEGGDRALARLADRLGAHAQGAVAGQAYPAPPAGGLNAHAAGASVARWLPGEAIISDDGVTASQPVFAQTVSARPHDWLMLTGGAIGQGLPVAIGAAVACPERKVVALSGDGAAMYTVQSLWTMAREQLDVTTVVFANGVYRILGVEFTRTGSGDSPGPAAGRLLDLEAPVIDWVGLAESLGVKAVRCTTAEAFDAAFRDAMASRGPLLIEAVIGGSRRPRKGDA